MMTFEIFQEKHLWRTLLSSSAISKGFNSKPHVFVCGPNGIHYQIMDETQRAHTYMMRMTKELNRVRRSQPGRLQQWQAKTSLQLPQPPAPSPGPAPSQAPAQSSAPSVSPSIPVNTAPVSKNPGMANAPRNAPFPNSPGADPWAQHKPRRQWCLSKMSRSSMSREKESKQYSIRLPTSTDLAPFCFSSVQTTQSPRSRSVMYR